MHAHARARQHRVAERASRPASQSKAEKGRQRRHIHIAIASQTKQVARRVRGACKPAICGVVLVPPALRAPPAPSTPRPSVSISSASAIQPAPNSVHSVHATPLPLGATSKQARFGCSAHSTPVATRNALTRHAVGGTARCVHTARRHSSAKCTCAASSTTTKCLAWQSCDRRRTARNGPSQRLRSTVSDTHGLHSGTSVDSPNPEHASAQSHSEATTWRRELDAAACSCRRRARWPSTTCDDALASRALHLLVHVAQADRRAVALRLHMHAVKAKSVMFEDRCDQPRTLSFLSSLRRLR